MELSCGALVFYQEKLLVVLGNTDDKYYNLPKGLSDELGAEKPLDTAVREVWEETNINILEKGNTIKDLGRFKYIPGKKDLHLFSVELTKKPELKCHSTYPPNNLPEVVEFLWIDPTKFRKYFSPNLQKVVEHIIQRGLI
jgi:8-oxo-dGTP pyrophosphatase MutT (NUDIX family)